MQPLIRGLIELGKRVVAAVDAAAFGAGPGIAPKADVVPASQRARLAMGVVRAGPAPDFAAMPSRSRVGGSGAGRGAE